MLEVWVYARRKPRRPSFECLDSGYGANVDYNAAKSVARKLSSKLQRGQKSPAGRAFCQYARKSGVMTVNATDVASDTPVSIERQSTDKPTQLAAGSCRDEYATS